MAPATGTALLLLVAFVLPGFITLITRESTYVVRDADTPFERLLLSLRYSVAIYGVVLIGAFVLGVNANDITEFYRGKQAFGRYIFVGALVLVVLPLVFAESGRLWRRSGGARPWLLRVLRISPAHSTRSGWDHFFGSNQAALVRVTLDDGRVVGGYFSEDSLAGYSEHTEDLFLEERWELDADSWFARPATSSLGLWIPHSHIVSLEVYSPPEPSRTRAAQFSRWALAAVAVLWLLERRHQRNP